MGQKNGEEEGGCSSVEECGVVGVDRKSEVEGEGEGEMEMEMEISHKRSCFVPRADGPM